MSLRAISGGQLASITTTAGIAPYNVPVMDPGLPLADYDADAIGALNVWRTQPSVRKVVDFIARAIASTPMKLYSRDADDDRTRITTGPLYQILGVSPNAGQRMTPYRYWHSTVVDWLIFDRWATAKLSDPAALQRIPAARCRFIPDGLGNVRELVVDGNLTAPFYPSEILFDHGYSPLGSNGISPMATLRQTLEESVEAVKYRRAVWRNGARVPAVITRPADAAQEGWAGPDGGRARFVQDFRNWRDGGGREGDVPILEDGMQLLKVDTFSPKDTLDLQGRQLTDAEVAAFFHVAPALVGAGSVNYATMDAYRQGLYRESLGGYFIPIEQVVNLHLVPDLDPTGLVYAEWDLDAKLRGSFDEQAAILSTAAGAPWLLRSEARGMQNLPKIADSDQLVTPLNVITGGLASPRDTAPEPAPGDVIPPKSRRPDGSKARPADLGTFDTETAALEHTLTGFYGKQAAAIVAALKAADDDPDVEHVWALNDWHTELKGLLLGRADRVAQLAAWKVLDAYNPDAAGWSAPVMLPWLAKASAHHSQQMNDATLAVIKSAVADPGDDDPPEAVAKQLKQHGLVAAAVWSRLVGKESAGFGGHDAAKASGVTTKTWTTSGANPRPAHAALDGQSVAVDDVFGNGLRWPGDTLNGEPDETAGCTCSVTYTTGG